MHTVVDVVVRVTGVAVWRGAGLRTDFPYDPGGRLAEAMSPEATVTMSHDATGRVLTETTNGHHRETP